jgi:predicted Zn-dependent protease
VLTFQFSGGSRDNLSAQDTAAIVRCCGHVENKLSVLSENLTDDVLISIAQHCPHVKHLTLQNGKGYTATGLMAIVRQCASLRTIVVHAGMSHVVNPFSVQLWQYVRPQLRVSTDIELHKYFLLQDCDLK